MTQIAPHFDGVKPFPTVAALPPRTHNEPPLDERIVGELESAIDETPGLRSKIVALLAKGKELPACDSDEAAGKFGDFMRQVAACAQAVDQAREGIKRPYLTATRALDAKSKGYTDQLADVRAAAKRLLDAFVAEQSRLARVEQARIQAELQRLADEARAAEQADRLARAAAEAAAVGDVEPVALPEPETVPIYVAPAPAAVAPVFRGDLGSRVGVKTVWRHEIESVRKLPDQILKHPNVVEALGKVVAAQVRGGARDIKGCRIWSEDESSVR